MASETIAAMPAVTALAGPELLYAVQSGGNNKVTATQIKAFAADVYNVDAFGAKGDGATDDSVAIQNCINAAQAAAGGAAAARFMVTFTSGKTYKCIANVLTFDPLCVRIYGHGAVLDFSGYAGSAPYITIVQQVGDTALSNWFGIALAALEDIYINGNWSQLGSAKTTPMPVGIKIIAGGITLSRVSINNCGRAFDMSGTNSFGINFFYCNAISCYSGFSQMCDQATPNGYVGYNLTNPAVTSLNNSGESIQAFGCVIQSCVVGIDWFNFDGTFVLFRCAVDSVDCFIRCQGGTVYANNCHFETAIVLTGYFPFMCYGSIGGRSNASALRCYFFGEIVLRDCEVVFTAGTPPIMIDCFSPPPFGVRMYNVGIGGGWTFSSSPAGGNTLSNNSGGNIQINQSWSADAGLVILPPLIDTANSWNSDPTFANATLVDMWSITKDTAALGNPLTGSNISISMGTTNPHTGTHALAAAKSGAAATVAAFGIYLPCRAMDQVGLGVWYGASANSLGTTALNVKYIALQGFAPFASGRGAPLFSNSHTAVTGNSTNAGAPVTPPLTITPTTVYQQIALATLLDAAPTWATHVLIEFDMAAMAAGTLYIGAPFEVYQQ